MTRRRLTIKRLDPWSVLKFSFLLNLALMAMLLLAGRVVWFAIEQLQIIETICDQASQILELDQCGIDGANLFWNAVILGLFGVVVMTGFAVFFAFLLNLIGDLTGGLAVTVLDDTPVGELQSAAVAPRARVAFNRADDPSSGHDQTSVLPEQRRPPVAPIRPAPVQLHTSASTAGTSGDAAAAGTLLGASSATASVGAAHEPSSSDAATAGDSSDATSDTAASPSSDDRPGPPTAPAEATLTSSGLRYDSPVVRLGSGPAEGTGTSGAETDRDQSSEEAPLFPSGGASSDGDGARAPVFPRTYVPPKD